MVTPSVASKQSTLIVRELTGMRRGLGTAFRSRGTVQRPGPQPRAALRLVFGRKKQDAAFAEDVPQLAQQVRILAARSLDP
jgi:hypothetical protein